VDYNSCEMKIATLALAVIFAGVSSAQGPSTPPATAPPPHNNVRKAIQWKQFNYTCDAGLKLIVYIGGQLAKVRLGDKAYLMHQTESADGNRYSDGKVVWWGKGNGGFLQDDQEDGNGKMILQGCKLDEAQNAATITGTVTYLQRMALPTNAVILVQLLDVSLADAPSKVVAEQSISLGQRQVPIPFTLNYDASKIDEKHSYSLSAKITVDGVLRFTSDQSYPVLTRGTPSKADIVLKQVSSPATQ
jgi:putative lipoprotein